MEGGGRRGRSLEGVQALTRAARVLLYPQARQCSADSSPPLLMACYADPAGGYLLRHYLRSAEGKQDGADGAAAVASVALLLAASGALAEATAAGVRGDLC